MALTSTEKARIILFLGWSAKTLIVDSTDYSKIVADRMENLTAPFEAEIRTLLNRLIETDSNLEKSQARLGAKKIGDIELRDDEIYLLKKEKRRLVATLSNLIGIECLIPGSRGISVCV